MDSLRNKLIHLLESINHLYYSLTVLPFNYNDLLTRYNLILSSLTQLSLLLSSHTTPDLRKDKHSASKLVPTEAVESAKEYIIATLLRIKQVRTFSLRIHHGILTFYRQTPQVEQQLHSLIENLPVQDYDLALSTYNDLTRQAAAHIQQIKTELDGEGWDWKARVTGVDEDEDEPIPKVVPEVVEGVGERAWTLEELVKYQRTGAVPLS